MNWVDLLLFLIVIGVMLWGMFRGAVRQLFDLLGLYVAIVASLWLYQSLALLVGRLMPNLSQSGREAIAFLFLFILISNGVSAILRSIFVPASSEERKRKARGREGIKSAIAKATQRFLLAPFNLLGGILFAFLTICVWISLVTAALRYALVVPWLAYDGIRAFLLDGLMQSRLMVLFDQVLHITYALVRPLVPHIAGGELPAIFSGPPLT